MQRLRAILAAHAALFLCVSLAHALPPGSRVLISEVQTRGSGGAGDEFVELLNPTCDVVDLSGWTLAFRSSTAPSFATRATLPAGVQLAPGEHYLVAGLAYGGTVTPDLTLASAIPDAGVLKLSTSIGGTVDAVGFYYDATTQAAVQMFNPEGTVVSNLPHDNTNTGASDSNVGIARKDSGTHDYSDNVTDFDSGVVSNPESSVSADVTIDCGASVGSDAPPQVLSFALAGRNPVLRSATLACTLPKPARVRIDVYSVDGRHRATLVDRDMDAGRHLVPLDLGNARGTHLGPGVWLVRLTAGGESRSVRIVGLD
jgi:hypothetical protein